MQSTAGAARCCSMCKRKIIRFTSTKDWDTRRMHKSCWIKHVEEMTLKRMLEDYEKTKEHVANVLSPPRAENDDDSL